MKKLKIVSSLTLLSLLAGSSYGQSPELPVFISDSLDQYMQLALDQWQVPGAAVAVIMKGQVVYMKGFGVLEKGKQDKVDENTLFMIGSNTKAFTGTSMALLDYEGKCSLNDKVQQWLPGFTMKDPWVAKELNLTDILCHRIGMETFQGDFMYWTSDLTIKQVVEKFGKLTPEYGFRSKWGYTNAGFAIAGECIEKISGMPWRDFIQQNILTPLKMDRTLTSSLEIPGATNAAKPYTVVDGNLEKIPYPEIDNLAPAGSISSSLSDMSHWLMCLLDSGRYDGKQVIPWRVIDKTRQPESIEGTIKYMGDLAHFKLYGLGWELQDYDGREIVSHTGGVNGFVSSVTLVPEDKDGIIIFTNTDMNDLYSAAKWDILDALLGMPFLNYNQYMLLSGKRYDDKQNEVIREERDSVAMKLKPAFPLAGYSGKYTNDAYGYINIRVNNNSLEMTFQHHPNLKGKLESLGGNRFLCTYNDPEFGIKVIPFKTSGNSVESFTLHVADFIEYTGYEFKKTD